MQQDSHRPIEHVPRYVRRSRLDPKLGQYLCQHYQRQRGCPHWRRQQRIQVLEFGRVLQLWNVLRPIRAYLRLTGTSGDHQRGPLSHLNIESSLMSFDAN